LRDAISLSDMHHLRMGTRRVLVANEFTSYRQTLATVIRDLRPHVEVFEAESESLDGEVARLGPDLVVCSRVTHAVKQRVANWVELYPRLQALLDLLHRRRTQGETGRPALRPPSALR